MIYYHKTTRRVKPFVVGSIVFLLAFLAVFALYKAYGSKNKSSELSKISSGDKSNDGRTNSKSVTSSIIEFKSGAATIARGSEIILPSVRNCDNYAENVSSEIRRLEPVAAIGEMRKKITDDLLKGTTEIDRAAAAVFFLRNQRYVAFNDCSNGVCDPSAEQKFNFENQNMLNALVQIAATTKSGAIYSWALNACGSGPAKLAAENSCSTLSRQKAAELDSKNAWAWLTLASEFSGKGNTAGVEESLFRAANAESWTSASDEFSKLLTPRIALVRDPIVAFGLLNDLKSMSTEMKLSALNTISTACPINADENRKQICKKLTSNLLANSIDLVSLSVSLKVAGRVGISVSDLKSKQDEYERLQTLLPSKNVMASVNVSEGCKSASPVISFLESSLLNGEIVALAELAKQERK